jgi:hypothetical protein
VRMTQPLVLSSFLAVFLCLQGASLAGAQDDQFLMPEQSAAKAKELLNQAIDALGGSTYLNLHDETCSGRIGQFDHAGEVTGFGTFIDYEIPPNMERQENLPKRNIIEVYNGDKGWDLDRGGVSPAPQSDLLRFQDDVKKDLDNILRARIHESSMVFRYGGPDIVDLKQAEWVELVDSDNRTIRIALATATHLPIRKVVESRDPKTRMKTEEIEYYSNYHPLSGIETPFQITREHNGIKDFQVFFDKCEYNTGVPPYLFTKESLDDRWAKVGKKEKDKKDKYSSKNSKDSDDSDSSDSKNKN